MICCPPGILAAIIFIGLIGLSILAMLTIIIISLVKNKKIKKPFSQYLLCMLIPFIVGLIGCATIDFLSWEIAETLDNWGAICIAVLSIALSFWMSVKAYKKVKEKQDF